MQLEQTFAWRGRQVRWDVWGEGPPVVFCHGTPWSSALWRPFADALSSGFRVHLWDMPGYGQSSMKAEHRVSLDVQGELLSDLIGHWGLDRPHLITHDYGGAVALRAPAARRTLQLPGPDRRRGACAVGLGVLPSGTRQR